MGVCEAYRIPHSHFLGGPHVWSQQDRDKAIWFRQRQAEHCPSCGTHPDEWDPAAGGDRNAYMAQVSRCAGCAAIEQQQEALDTAAKTPGGKPPRGSRVMLQRRVEVTVDGGDHGAGVPHERAEQAGTTVPRSRVGRVPAGPAVASSA